MKDMGNMGSSLGNKNPISTTVDITHGWENDLQNAGTNPGIVHGWEPAMRGSLPMQGSIIKTQNPGMAMGKKKGR